MGGSMGVSLRESRGRETSICMAIRSLLRSSRGQVGWVARGTMEQMGGLWGTTGRGRVRVEDEGQDRVNGKVKGRGRDRNRGRGRGRGRDGGQSRDLDKEGEKGERRGVGMRMMPLCNLPAVAVVAMVAVVVGAWALTVVVMLVAVQVVVARQILAAVLVLSRRSGRSTSPRIHGTAVSCEAVKQYAIGRTQSSNEGRRVLKQVPW